MSGFVGNSSVTNYYILFRNLMFFVYIVAFQSVFIGNFSVTNHFRRDLWGTFQSQIISVGICGELFLLRQRRVRRGKLFPWQDQGPPSYPVAVADADDRREEDKEAAEDEAEDGEAARDDHGGAEGKLHLEQGPETRISIF
jgi:hypothetical protein